MNAEEGTNWLSRLDYIFILRPMLFFPGWSTMLAGHFIDSKSSWFPWGAGGNSQINVLILMTGFALIMGSSFVLNQLEDIESDKRNRKLFIIADGYISKKSAWREVVILTAGSLLLGFLIKTEIGWLFIIFFVLTGIFYNFYPFRLKDRPWGSLTANALMGWLAFAVGWSAAHETGMQLFIDSMPYLFINTSLYLFTLLPDREGDEQSEKQTLAVSYGATRVIYTAVLIYFTGLILSVCLDDKQALLFYLLSLPFYIVTFRQKNIESTIRTTKYAILFFAISICLRWPVYFLIMLSGFLVTKLYFKKRFNFNYPNFSGK